VGTQVGCICCPGVVGYMSPLCPIPVVGSGQRAPSNNGFLGPHQFSRDISFFAVQPSLEGSSGDRHSDSCSISPHLALLAVLVMQASNNTSGNTVVLGIFLPVQFIVFLIN